MCVPVFGLFLSLTGRLFSFLVPGLSWGQKPTVLEDRSAFDLLWGPELGGVEITGALGAAGTLCVCPRLWVCGAQVK